jgi:Domain of unknown function (DUF1998)/DEAD/DEAH box helicase/Helicase conserved C-terminal domain
VRIERGEQMSASGQSEYGVSQVAAQMQLRLQRYLEAQYHIRDTSLIEERRALLCETGTIAQHPFLETTPTYRLAEEYSSLGLPAPIGETLAELASWRPGIGVFPRPYRHQADALTLFFKKGADLIVATGTGSGKTESFLFPVLGHLLLEASQRRNSFRMPGCRALLLYPMNALVSDQISRLRKLFGNERLRDLFRTRYGRQPRFGMYTSRTAYPGPRFSKKDQKFMLPILRYYMQLEEPDANLPEAEREFKRTLCRELKDRGRWPAKDLKGFFGKEGGRWNQRLQTQAGDSELLTRHEIQGWCPDILVTNYSMLEYMLLRPVERSIFRETRNWLAENRQNSLILVLDEAHMYRGAGGAEVGLLIRRLQSRLGVGRDRLRCILTSASLGEGAEAMKEVKRFAVGLTGHPEQKAMPFEVITGLKEEQAGARAGDQKECEALAAFALPTFFRLGERPEEAMEALLSLASRLGWPRPTEIPTFREGEDVLPKMGEFRKYLYDQLMAFGPIGRLISKTSGKAKRFSDLSSDLFEGSEKKPAELATAVLLALGTFANNGEKPVLPTRVHLMFRGLPSLYACINPRCDVRRYQPGQEQLLGRLYSEPKTRCSCALEARVYELYTHRDCGAAFLRVFGRGKVPTFYWHEQGGDVGVSQPLEEDFLLVEPPHDDMIEEAEPVWVEMSTGRVEAPDPAHPERYRQFYRPIRGAAAGDATPAGSYFDACPACTKAQAREKIMDLATKGEQPFATLVREQLVLQPMKRRPDRHYPNGGRKVLLFSDGRQKAARLARDLPREVEFDSFRQALALAVSRVSKLGREVTLDERLYASFVSVCSDFNLYFFESGAQAQLFEATRGFRELYDGDLALALEENWRPEIPERYSQALLRQLSDPYYSLYAACAAVTQPTAGALRILRRQLEPTLTMFSEDQWLPVISMWTQQLLDRAAFNLQLNQESRYRINNFYRPVAWNEKVPRFEKLLLQAGIGVAELQLLRERLYLVLADRDAHGSAFLKPSSLVLSIAMEQNWVQCMSCGTCMLQPVLGRCVSCRRDRLENRPPDHPYMTSRKGYFRESLRAVLNGERPIHLTAEEHTAQLSQRDAGVVWATTEEFELRFQDVALGPDKPPVDVLSCTTTMEVGIDIGSLTAVALRNVPPQRENYQQRSGRSGRRGSAVSTVVTYAQGGPHDNYYYSAPEEIISGKPRSPKVKVDNHRLARRHIHSFLIQTFFHGRIDRLSKEAERALAESRSNLFSALGTANGFFTGEDDFSLLNFKSWLGTSVFAAGAEVADEIARWLPDELFASAENIKSRLEKKRAFAIETARTFLEMLEELRSEFRPRPAASTGGSATAADDEDDVPMLLDVFFDRGLLPTYAFPTDLCSFYVFEREAGIVRIKERPQQSKDKALSEYAPGRLLVINKQTYRVGGIYLEGTNSATPGTELFAAPLGSYVYCQVCEYIRTSPLVDADEPCPVCRSPLNQHELLDPPGFSPENGRPVDERDREQEISYATSAQFPSPATPDQFEWKTSAGTHLRHAYEEDRRLVVVNRGPEDAGFRVCRLCGAAKPETEPWPQHGHGRPFQLSDFVMQRQRMSRNCNGLLHDQPIYLGSSFLTDLLLLRVPLHDPLSYDPRHRWLQDALRTTAEALSLGATRVLDVDPGELSAGYRLTQAAGDEDPGALGIADFYLFDTASGGAGYAAEAGDILPRVLDEALRRLENCPNRCERSCTECLRYYGNRYWQERLDRFLAMDILNYARFGRAPVIENIERQSWQLHPLHRYLELEGWRSEVGAMIAGTRVPLAVLAVGTYPALLNRDAEAFHHPLHELDSEDDVKLVFLNQFIVSRDLPTAYRQFRRQAGLDR